MRLKKDEEVKHDPEVGDQDLIENDINGLISTLQKASDERDQLKDQLMRTMADFQNFRRRNEEQRKQLETFATERFVTALLPVLDNFERAIDAYEAGGTSQSLSEGVKAVDRQLRTVLEGQKVTRIPTLGEMFDPDVHEALSMEPSEEHDENTVIGELEPGYKMGDKVIRPARVRVSRKP